MSNRKKRRKKYVKQSLGLLTAALLIGAAAAVIYGLTLISVNDPPETTSENDTREELLYEELVDAYSKEFSVPQNIIYGKCF